MEGVDGEGLLVGGCGVIAVGDVEDVAGDILFDNEPGTTGEAHTLTLTNGMEPKATMFANALAGFELDDITRHLTQIATDIIVVADFAQETDAL